MKISEQDLEKIVRLADGKMTPQEVSEVEAWLATNPDLEQEYREQRYVSALLNGLLKESEPLSVPQNNEEYWRDIQGRIASLENSNRHVSKFKGGTLSFWQHLAQARKTWIPTAAAACLVVGWVCLIQVGSNPEIYSDYQEVDAEAGVSSITMESNNICIELLTSTYSDTPFDT